MIPVEPLARRIALLLVLMSTGFAALPTWAQTVTVRGGEHGDFTRLVLSLPERTGWSYSADGRAGTLRLERSGLDFDTGQVFRFIPRTRLTALAPLPDGSGLLLDLACDCPVAVFEDRPGLLVLDIRSPPEPAMPLASLQPDSTAGDALEPFSVYWQNRPELLAIVQMPAALTAPPRPAEEAEEPPLLLERDMLLWQFSRATAQGLLNAARPGLTADATADAFLSAAQAGPDQREVGMHIRTAADPLPGAALAGALHGAMLQACPPQQNYAVAEWGDARPFAAQIVAASRHLMGEFDIVSEAAALRLARLYIHFGFGAEARAVLRALVPDASARHMLEPLAEIVDQGAAPEATALQALGHCGPSVALWAALSHPSFVAGVPVDAVAVTSSFGNLPPQLRRHLGPGLAARFLEAGDAESARRVQNAIARLAHGDPAEMALLDARFQLAQSEPELAEARLEQVLAGGSRAGPEALALYLQARLERGAAISPERIEAAAVLARELGSRAPGPELARLEVVARAVTGDATGALAAMAGLEAATLAAPAGAPSFDRVVDAVFGHLAISGNDAAFLRGVFGHDHWRAAGLHVAARQALAARFLELGFATEARDALADPSEATVAEILLIAQSHLAEGQPALALRLLAGHRRPEAAGLRGDALMALGEYRAAAAAYRAAGAEEAEARALWRAGQASPALPEPGAGQTDEPFSAAPPDDATPADGPRTPGLLGQSRAALGHSAELREELDTLFSTFPTPENQR